MVAREGFVYEQKPLSVTRNVVVREGWSLVRVVVRQGFYCISKHIVFSFQVRTNFRTAITIPERSWARFRDILSDFVDKASKDGDDVTN